MIRLADLSIDLGEFVLDNFSLSVDKGEFFMVVGPSGAGKTVLLESIAGLRHPSGGRILIGGRDVTGLPPERRRVALVYQDYALFPHMTVEENIRWGLRFLRDPDPGHVEGLFRLLRLERLLERSPDTLSGGEQQRVALARALAVKPSVILLDEPISALDPRFREDLQDYLSRINREGMTIMMVTHDFNEVLSLGHRVAVIVEGSLQQVGDVKTVFREPANRLVAEFVGMKNLFPSSVKGRRACLEGGVSLVLNGQQRVGECLIGIRPEDVMIGGDLLEDTENVFSGRVVSIVPRGMAFEVVFQVEDLRLTGRMLSSALVREDVHPGGECRVGFCPEAIHVFKGDNPI
ncbi:MAG TPA: ABC transporter ATP-binding protein [Synergistales bacterium]|nr:ABC transporter ATP-binding protein [Synergistales bacterium]MDI9393563.1 ABC transporter ATP-binding protein [Synergistota bacterium]NLV65000.1 ABC transporter ATP-binding protein [Synergistaceae bacterium]HRW87039.1 ABC transporter ATP-binding protein [Thermovirgaceae bacterium]MDD3134728.1 ABC transporter ATP-binding protein [Synergistales bacterium]